MASMLEIGHLAWTAGVRSPVALTEAIAIAVAESGGNADRVGDVSLQNDEWGPSVGLWQIRSRKAETGKGSTRDASALKDPAFNARSMASISGKGTNWDPWSVTHAGRDPAGYARYTAAKLLAAPAASAVLAGAPVAAVATEGLSDIAKLGVTIHDAVETPIRGLKWFMDVGTQRRLVYGFIGIVGILAGAYILAKPAVQATQEKATQAVAKVAKVALTKGKK